MDDPMQTSHQLRRELSSLPTFKGNRTLFWGQPITYREDHWFERGGKEATHVKLIKPSMNKVNIYTFLQEQVTHRHVTLETKGKHTQIWLGQRPC